MRLYSKGKAKWVFPCTRYVGDDKGGQVITNLTNVSDNDGALCRLISDPTHLTDVGGHF